MPTMSDEGLRLLRSGLETANDGEQVREALLDAFDMAVNAGGTLKQKRVVFDSLLIGMLELAGPAS